MKVVIDSNVIIADFHFQGKSLRDCLNDMKLCGYSLYVPEVVRCEVAAHYKRKLEDFHKKICKEIKQWFPNYLRMASLPSEQDVAKLASAYCTELSKHLKNFGVEIGEYPEISHKEMVERDVMRQRHLRYRDALIWESVVNVAETEGEPVAFITEDGDFGCWDKETKKQCLHKELVKELEHRGVASNRVLLFRNMKTFCKQRLYSELESGQYSGFNVDDWLRTNLQNHEVVVEIDSDVFESQLAENTSMDICGLLFEVERVDNLFQVEIYENEFYLWDTLVLRHD